MKLAVFTTQQYQKRFRENNSVAVEQSCSHLQITILHKVQPEIQAVNIGNEAMVILWHFASASACLQSKCLVLVSAALFQIQTRSPVHTGTHGFQLD